MEQITILSFHRFIRLDLILVVIKKFFTSALFLNASDLSERTLLGFKLYR